MRQTLSKACAMKIESLCSNNSSTLCKTHCVGWNEMMSDQNNSYTTQISGLSLTMSKALPHPFGNTSPARIMHFAQSFKHKRMSSQSLLMGSTAPNNANNNISNNQQTTNNKQQHATNNKQRTINTTHQTTNNKQQTTHSIHQTSTNQAQ